MIAIEIIMLIIGIAAVIASFRLSDEKETDNTKSNIDAEELEEKIKDAVKETEDYIITKADEKFSQISNDKIMGFNGFADIIVETEDFDAGIIIELKYSKTFSGMDKACEKAITQIKEKRYDEYLKNDDRHDIMIYGIAFCKKKCKVIAHKI